MCLHPSGHEYRHLFSIKQQLHWHPNAPIALSPPKPAAKSSHGYNLGVKVRLDIRRGRWCMEAEGATMVHLDGESNNVVGGGDEDNW
jgi:hypothetical protein